MADTSPKAPFGFLAQASAVTPLDMAAAAESLADVAASAKEEGEAALAKALARDTEATRFLAAIFDLSPFLRDCARRSPGWLSALMTADPGERVDAIVADIDALAATPGMTEAVLMERLRALKTEAHFVIGLADLSRQSDSRTTVRRLSRLADACVRAAIDFLLADLHASGKIVLPYPDEPSKQSGLIVLGMGKLGAHELNYSSDIDLIVLFEADARPISDPIEATDMFARMTRRLVRILQDRTGHGYVFRTDLRLRPDPGSTPLALPTEAALIYYESRGQNWERAAMIKARPVAGDIAAGERFLKELEPYVWRKYMDFAAIADVHSIKRQIHAHKGFGDIAVKGHNVKLGRGGIREIEFFVQTQQLIAGGRFPELRKRETVAVLATLAERGWISEATRDALTEQYWFLRNVEHALQIVADEQTHTIPEDDEGVERTAHLLGFADAGSFSEAFRKSLRTVEGHYAALFEASPELSTGMGNLVFTGDVDDPGTIETLTRLGFERPSDICRVIRTWHYGRYRATRSAEARERLTELTPALLETFGNTRRADEALLRFDEFLAGLPAGIQLFSLLQSNPGLLALLARIMGAAPRLAAIITRRPHIFDGLLDPGLMSELPDKAYLAGRLKSFLEGAELYEDILDRLRIFCAEQKFLIGIRLLTSAIDAARAGMAFSDLADLTIGAALDAVIEAFAARHGRVAGGRVCVLGMGKLGSRELTAGSDVDLILLYEHDPRAEDSDGEKPLAPSQYYARLTQRLIAAVSAPTAEGVLYELDLRLRPSGNKGPVATHFESFRKYQRNEAWTWEHMALTRAAPSPASRNSAPRWRRKSPPSSFCRAILPQSPWKP
jgi:glutamate-ammonia-ligase adenylyltransferase